MESITYLGTNQNILSNTFYATLVIMDQNVGEKSLKLYPMSLSIAKVIAPLKYKRGIVKAIETLGEIEPIQVDPRIGADHLQIEDRRNELETLRSKLNSLMSSIDQTLIPSDNPISIVDGEQETIDFVNGVYKEHGLLLDQLIKRRSEIDSRVMELESLIKLLKELGSLGVGSELNASLLTDTPHTKSFVGRVYSSQVNTLHWYISQVTENRYFIREGIFSENEMIMLVTVLKEDEEASSAKLKSINFQDITVPNDIELDGLTINDCENEIEDLSREDLEILDKFEIFSKEHGYHILAALETCNIELQRITVELKMRRTSTTCILWAWLPEERKEDFKTSMHSVTEGSALFDFKKSQFDPKLTPTYLKNSEFMNSMRSLVTSFGTPSSKEVDPYPFVKFLFPVLFAIMFADVGHGASLFLIGLYAKRKKDKMDEIPKGISGYFYGGAELLIIMGATSFFMGFAFNSVFGDETLLWNIAPIRAIFENTTWAFFFTVTREEEDGIVVNVIERNYVNFLIFSFVVGAIVILLGLGLNLYQLKNYRHSNADLYAAITLTGIYVSAILTAVSAVMGISGLVVFFVLLMIGCLIATLVIEQRAHGVDGLMLGVDHIISLLSNTFSFGRLLAMNTIHFVLAFLPYLFLNKIEAFNGVLNHNVDTWMGSGFLIGVWIFAAFLGALVVLPVETTFSTLQSLRLNWVEFFGKFYKGEGIEFKPVKVKRNYTQERVP